MAMSAVAVSTAMSAVAVSMAAMFCALAWCQHACSAGSGQVQRSRQNPRPCKTGFWAQAAMHEVPVTMLDVLQGLSGPAIDMRDPVIGLLFSLVAASAHIIVPAAVFNLKVLYCTQRLLLNILASRSHQNLALIGDIYDTSP